MHGHRRQSRRDERGRKNDRQKHVSRGDRHTDAEDETGRGPHQQQQPDGSTGDIQQIVDQGPAQTRQRQCPDYKADASQHHDQLDEKLAGGMQKFDDLAPVPTFPRQLVEQQKDAGRDVGRYRFTLQIHQHKDQHCERGDVVPTFPQRIAHRGQLRLVQAMQALQSGMSVHLQKQADEIQQRGDCGGKCDLVIRYFQKRRHHEGRRSHDGRQQDAAGGCTSLYARRVVGRHAGPLHRRNRELTRRQNVGHHAAAHGPHESR